MNEGGKAGSGLLGPRHVLAGVAGRHCEQHLGCVARRWLIGGVACGACWERAIRDDERAAVVFGLPRDVEPDPELVDEIAVELACRGERVRLTPTERRAAVAVLAARGLSLTRIAQRLSLSGHTVAVLLAPCRADRAAGSADDEEAA